MNHYERQGVINRVADGNTQMWLADRQREEEYEEKASCYCCGCIVDDGERFCGDCLYDQGRDG